MLCISRQAVSVLILYIAVGSALGGVIRYLFMSACSRLLGESFPWGTLLVNLLGSFLLGALFGAGIVPGDGAIHFEALHAFAAIGFCGGLTTFSTFSLQNLSLLSQGSRVKFAANIFGSVGLCLIVATLGYALLERWTA